MTIAGALAGATLGFIWGNTRGAHYGFKAGYRAKRWRMPPIPYRKRRVSAAASTSAKRRKVIPSRTIGGPRATAASGVTKGSARRGAPKLSLSSGRTRNRVTNNNRRRAGSARRRTYKRKAKRGVGPALSGVDASFSHARYGSGARVYRGFKTRGERCSFTSLVSTRSAGLAGTQAVGLLNTWTATNPTDPPTDTTRNEWYGLGYGVNSYLIGYCQQQLIRRLQRSNFTYAMNGQTDTQLPGWKTSKFVIRGLTISHTIKSTSVVPIVVTLYDCVLRPQPPARAVDASVNATTDTQWRDPLTLWSEGLRQVAFPDTLTANQGTGFAITDVYGQNAGTRYASPGMKPFSSPMFCRSYRVFKTTRLILAPGQTHIHTVRIAPKNMFPMWPAPRAKATTPNTLADNDHMFGVETFTMMVHHGTPVHSASSSGLIQYSASSCDTVTRARCEFQVFDKSMKEFHHFDMLSNTPITDAVTVDELDGNVTTVGNTTGQGQTPATIGT